MLTGDKPIDELGFTESTERCREIGNHILSVLMSNSGQMNTTELLSQANNSRWPSSEMRVSLSILHVHRVIDINDRFGVVTLIEK
jgi:hypothetical protein